MRNEEIERKICDAVERLTPDVLDNILSKCAEQNTNVYVMQTQKKKNHWIQTAGAIAAAFALVFSLPFASSLISGGRVEALVMLDVNPSIEIRLNGDDRVLNVYANNEDAVKILDNMDLKDTHIKVAVNALVGSMLKYGYIQENANSVLLSVEGKNEEKSALLRKDLTESIGMQLYMVNGAVISQSLSEDESLRTLADKHYISYGKAALVQKILDENIHLLFDDLASLPVNELNLLVGSKNIQAEGLDVRGNASDTAYIGEDMAKQTAFGHASVSENDVERLHIELDYDDGVMVYDVEFYYGGSEYDYEINAENGTIIKYDQEREESRDIRKSETDTHQIQYSNDFIGENSAADIAIKHSGVEANTDLKVDLDKDDGLYIYEVEFKAGNLEYEYEINATTGEVAAWETDK